MNKHEILELLRLFQFLEFQKNEQTWNFGTIKAFLFPEFQNSALPTIRSSLGNMIWGTIQEICRLRNQKSRKTVSGRKIFLYRPPSRIFKLNFMEKRHLRYLGEEKFCIDPAIVQRLCSKQAWAEHKRRKTQGKAPQTCYDPTVTRLLRDR